MNGIKAKLKYLANTFEIMRKVITLSAPFQKDPLENLNYWNVELQEAYFSPKEMKERYEKNKIN